VPCRVTASSAYAEQDGSNRHFTGTRGEKNRRYPRMAVRAARSDSGVRAATSNDDESRPKSQQGRSQSQPSQPSSQLPVRLRVRA
jgi:hypothetical protein